MSITAKARFCAGCGKRMLLSLEGYRCLECPDVFCKRCACFHFSAQHVLGIALTLRALDTIKRGRQYVTFKVPRTVFRAWENFEKAKAR